MAGGIGAAAGEACPARAGHGLRLRMAFQPILDAASGGVFAQEALVRGPRGEPADWVLSQVAQDGRYAFDRRCRSAAIAEGARLRVHETGARLSINVLANAVSEPGDGLRGTLRAAERTRLPVSSLMLEVTESERVRDPSQLRRALAAHRDAGLAVAIDDFGAGHAGLALLADFRPDLVKLDMAIVRGIELDRSRRTIVSALLRICADMGIAFVAEGVESRAEYETLRDLGVLLFQGHLLARPRLGALPHPEGVGPG